MRERGKRTKKKRSNLALVFDKKESEIQSSKAGSSGVTMLDGMEKKSERMDQT
jgi:hypothetical protein